MNLSSGPSRVAELGADLDGRLDWSRVLSDGAVGGRRLLEALPLLEPLGVLLRAQCLAVAPCA